jgi:hypothetical protein
MPLEIRFLKCPKAQHDILIGEIRLNDFVERLEVPVVFWSADQYEQQWEDGVNRLLSGALKSCLITAMYDPKAANFIVWWPMYRAGDVVILQNQILFLDRLALPFDPLDPYRSIGDRITASEEGEAISEWILSFDELLLARHGHRGQAE